MLIAARGSESLAVWDSTIEKHAADPTGWEVQRGEAGVKVIHKAWGCLDTAEIWPG